MVDSRFTLKLTDFGLPSLQRDYTHYDSEEAYYKRQMWRAPELQVSYVNYLTAGGSEPEGTQKGDVYSFAVIVQEILYRQGVFYLTDEDRDVNFEVEKDEMVKYRKIFDKIKFGLRPSLENFVCSKEITELLKKCWSAVIVERPDFHVINVTMRKLTK